MAGSLGRTLLVVGLTMAVVGVLLLLSERFPWLRLGRLPGDLTFGGQNARVYLPLGTSLLLSLVLSLLLWLFRR
ncbi:MAG: DUF2905 family protein [Anaeromyxobacter sp.]